MEDQKENNFEFSTIRQGEIMSQMTSQIKFPTMQIFKKYIKNFDENIEFKHHTKIKIIKKGSEEDEPEYAYLFVFNDRIIQTKDSIDDTKESLHNNPIQNVIEFSHIRIYKLIVHDTKNNEMFLHYYSDDFSKKIDLSFQFTFHKDSYCIHHFIKKYFILTWQMIFESTILKDFKKLIYNRHFILIKRNRWGKQQERILLITNGLIFNLKHYIQKEGIKINPKSIQWTDSIKACEKIGVLEGKEKELRLYMNQVKNNAGIIECMENTKFMKYKSVRDFEFFSIDERNEFIAIMRRNYLILTNNYLIIESIKESKETK